PGRRAPHRRRLRVYQPGHGSRPERPRSTDPPDMTAAVERTSANNASPRGGEGGPPPTVEGAIDGVLEIASGRPGALRRLTQNPLVTAGLAVLILVVVIVLLAPVLPLANPNTAVVAERLKPPFTIGHVLGTDQLGRDMLSRLVWGTRVSLAVGIAAAVA